MDFRVRLLGRSNPHFVRVVVQDDSVTNVSAIVYVLVPKPYNELGQRQMASKVNVPGSVPCFLLHVVSSK